jgi:FAD/FMN-containing dehydrogenase
VTTSRVQQPLSDDTELFLDSLRDIVGAAHVLTDLARVPGYVINWTGRWEGAVLVVVLPGNTEELAAVFTVCHRANVPIIPHGRIRGRVHSSSLSQVAVVVSTRRLNHSKANLGCATVWEPIAR